MPQELHVVLSVKATREQLYLARKYLLSKLGHGSS